jgi:predicted dienelactone hydrolase
MKFPNVAVPPPTILLCLLTMCLSQVSSRSVAAEAGWRPYEVAPSAANPDAIPVALYYPTPEPAHDIPVGPFTLHVAPFAAPAARIKGLIIVSHGTGGSELSLNSLPEALARDGYLAAALRHPGDNYQDHGLWLKPAGTYFTERPRQASRVIDALLADPAWKDRIPRDAKGPLIGAVGHSAGGFTVVALAGGQVDQSRIAAHCAADGADDPIFCSMGHDTPPAQLPTLDSAADPRVRAIAAMAPVGVMFTPESLQSISAPALIYAAEKDRWLPPRFRAAWIAQNMPGAIFRIIPNAWHFAFMDKVSFPIPTLDGDANADPPGFNRAALLNQLDQEIPDFFDRTLAVGTNAK